LKGIQAALIIFRSSIIFSIFSSPSDTHHLEYKASCYCRKLPKKTSFRYLVLQFL